MQIFEWIQLKYGKPDIYFCILAIAKSSYIDSIEYISKSINYECIYMFKW